MKRRTFLKGTALGGAAAVAAAASSFPKPALSQGRMQWRMVTSWPKGLPGLGTGAQRLADSIGTLTEGRLTVQLFAGGELVPALGVFDAVADGTAEMGHDASYYHLGKSPATAFFTAVPAGLLAHEQNAWLYWGGGQELWDELYEPFGLKGFAAGNTGVQMGGWLRNEINSMDDMRGLKFRMPGQGGQVLNAIGATQVMLPGAEIFPNLQSGTLDATEWVGPYNDLSLGFYQVAKFYYWPGFHEPGSTLNATVNLEAWNGLPADIQGIIQHACAAENDRMLAEFNARSAPALETLVREHGVQLRRYPNDVWNEFGRASGELMADLVQNGDAITRKIASNYLAFRQQILRWTRISDQGFAENRLLPFDYPRG